MITSDFKPRYEITCDYCSIGAEEVEADSWNYMIAEIKELGWLIISVDDEFKHKCPDCVG